MGANQRSEKLRDLNKSEVLSLNDLNKSKKFATRKLVTKPVRVTGAQNYNRNQKSSNKNRENCTEEGDVYWFEDTKTVDWLEDTKTVPWLEDTKTVDWLEDTKTVPWLKDTKTVPWLKDTKSVQ